MLTIVARAGWEGAVDLSSAARSTASGGGVVTTQFLYGGTGYEVAALGAVAIFGILLERRHGRWAPLFVFLVGGSLGMLLVVGVDEGSVALGGNAGALALLAAWSMRDLLARRRGIEVDGGPARRPRDRHAARASCRSPPWTRTRWPASAAGSRAS